MQVAQKASAPRRAIASRAALPGLVVGALTLAGAALRVLVADQPLFGDELATYWVITTHGFADVVSVVHSNAELTPPLYFLLSWLSAQISHAEELVRAPSLLAGTATIPLVYALGLRTVGRAGALLATTLTAFSPFMIYYSAEARAYAVMMFLIVLSTLALVRAVETGRTVWWLVYGLSSCLAMYSHYTCVFLLATQLAWVLWVHPEARRGAVLANLAALVLFLPWATGVQKDLTSPTSDILSLLSPFSLGAVRSYLGHWAVAFPYPAVPVRGMPGLLALALLGAGILMGVAGLLYGMVRRRRSSGGIGLRDLDRRVLLLLALAVSVPLGTSLMSAVGDNIMGVRNLAASWPAFSLSLSALVVAAGPRLRYAAAGLTVVAFAIAAVKMLDSDYNRPDLRGAADFIESRMAPGDVVIDTTAALSPGPLSTLDTTIEPGIPVFRAGAPAQRDHPFNFDDPIVSTNQAFLQAASAAPGKRVFYVTTDSEGFIQRQRALEDRASSSAYRRLSTRSFPGFVKARVETFTPRR